ncbi:MAG TPA: ribonuclease P protein component [Pirellulaceae bacterium]|nr:ribonuclease P protein component [Pirellulaceae bacterium]HMO93050.1 ribonuclease P protein component [Pirellulaceae bacterium]HMP69680.1 ribonuclease P protein component [Pirellulaceae bacterium]
MKNERFGKEKRVRKQLEFDRVYKSNVYATDATLVLMGVPNEFDYSRIGIVVSRKTGNAVQRNYWKRVIREAFRTQQSLIPTGFDFVVRPRKGAVCDPDHVRPSLRALSKRIAKRVDSLNQSSKVKKREI